MSGEKEMLLEAFRRQNVIWRRVDCLGNDFGHLWETYSK